MSLCANMNSRGKIKILQAVVYSIKYYRHFYDTAECIKSDQMFRDKMEGNKIHNILLMLKACCVNCI